MKYLVLTAALLTAACESTERSAAVRTVFAQQVTAWNAAGVDPVQLSPTNLMFATVGCATLSSLSSVLNPDAPGMDAEIALWCAEAVKAAAPAS